MSGSSELAAHSSRSGRSIGPSACVCRRLWPSPAPVRRRTARGDGRGRGERRSGPSRPPTCGAQWKQRHERLGDVPDRRRGRCGGRGLAAAAAGHHGAQLQLRLGRLRPRVCVLPRRGDGCGRRETNAAWPTVGQQHRHVFYGPGTHYAAVSSDEEEETEDGGLDFAPAGYGEPRQAIPRANWRGAVARSKSKKSVRSPVSVAAMLSLRQCRLLTCVVATVIPARAHGQSVHAPLAHAHHQEAPARAWRLLRPEAVLDAL